jgi:16S rRNA processing protein RimM
MKPDDFYFLGKILKTHGNQGHLLVLLDVDSPQHYRKMDSVFVDLGYERIPFAVESVRILEKNRALLKLAEVNSRDHATAFAGRELYLPVSALPVLTGNRFYYHEIRGFRVVDAIHGELGVVEDILELPAQPLIRIKTGKKEILVPLVDEVIIKVDRARKVLAIRAPEGLIAIYR